MRNSSSSSKNSDTKRIVVSFRIDKDLWMEFDEFVTESHGNYKKSPLIEGLIKRYIVQEKGKGK